MLASFMFWPFFVRLWCNCISSVSLEHLPSSADEDISVNCYIHFVGRNEVIVGPNEAINSVLRYRQMKVWGTSPEKQMELTKLLNEW